MPENLPKKKHQRFPGFPMPHQQSTEPAGTTKMRTRKAQKIWQELVKDSNNELRTMKVIDFGITRSARKKASKEKPTSHSDITVGIETSENLPRTVLENINPVEQEEEQENKCKKKTNPEAVTEEEENLKKHEEKEKTLKKTFKNITAEVKTVSNSPRRKPPARMSNQSPNLKRLRPARMTRIEARPSPFPFKPQDSRFNFKSLLSSWEDRSTSKATILTSAASRGPNLKAQPTANQKPPLKNPQHETRLASDPGLDAKLGKEMNFGKLTNDKTGEKKV
jgi:hypothetical protein